MEEKYNEATTQRPDGERVLDAPMVSIDLPYFIQQLKNEKIWNESDRNAMTVFKTDGMRILLIALHQGAVMSKHSAKGIISLHILEGRIQLNTNDQSCIIENGQLLTLHEEIPHSVEALDETIFLLTLTTSLESK